MTQTAHKKHAASLTLVLCALLGTSMTTSSLAASAKESLRAELRHPKTQTIKEKAGWVYKVIVSNPGTRSEGRHGVLLYRDKAVPAIQGDLRRTPIGTYRYLGPQEAKPYLWSASGWTLYSNNTAQKNCPNVINMTESAEKRPHLKTTKE